MAGAAGSTPSHGGSHRARVWSVADHLPEEVDRMSPATAARLRGTVDLAAILVDVPAVVLHLETGGRRYRIGLAQDERLGQRLDTLCAAVHDDLGPVLVGDATREPRFAEHPSVAGGADAVADDDGTRLRFFVSAPLVSPEGRLYGRLCAADTAPRPITTRLTRGLATLAERVTDILEIGFRKLELERHVAELEAARAELHRSNDERSVFAGQVSHDLRNPLTAVTANVEVIAALVEHDPALTELATAALDGVRRMDLMMRGYLEYAQVGGALDLHDVPLGSVARAVLADVGPLAAATGARIDVGDLPVVHADAGKLYTVLLNLVTNAIKFREHGTPPEIEIAAEQRPDGVRVTVADRGPGVPEEDRERIFGLFERGQDPAVVPGRGMGLCLARRVVEDHGGRIGVDDRPGGGSVFWFELPT